MATAPPETKVEKKKNQSLKNFKGVNTQSDRKAIDDDEFSWLENVMPIGRGNLMTLPSASAAIATLSGGTGNLLTWENNSSVTITWSNTTPATILWYQGAGGSFCYYMKSEFIAGVCYMFMFMTDGSAYQVQLTSPYTKTTLATAGTFSGTQTRICGWENQRICIIDTTFGFFDWNGSTLTAYSGTVQSVTILSGGTGFTSVPTVATSGGGSPSPAATFAATLALDAVLTIHAGGSGYIVGDALTLSGGTSTIAATLTVSAVNGSGGVTGINIAKTGSYTVIPTGNVAVTGGHGSSATFTLDFNIGSVTVSTPGKGYTSTPTLTVTGGAGANYNLQINMNTTAVGTEIASYAGRVWIANGRTVLFSAAQTYNDFNIADLAGAFTIAEDSLSTNITGLFAANNYLYIFGPSSINVLSNVTVTSPVLSSTGNILQPSTVTFSNSNLVDDMGTQMDCSVVAFGRTLVFAVDYGFYGVTGATPQKLSDHLDGLFPQLDLAPGLIGGAVVIFGQQCLCYLAQYNDPAVGLRPLLLLYFNKKWFFSSQLPVISFIAQANPVPDVSSMFATDGNKLYQLFENQTETITQTIQTKLWDMGSSLITKQGLKLGIEATFPHANYAVYNFDASVDSEFTTQPYTIQSTGSIITWLNNSNVIIAWTNYLSNPITWVMGTPYTFARTDVSNVGNYLGMTVTVTQPAQVYNGFHLQYELRTPWTGVPW